MYYQWYRKTTIPKGDDQSSTQYVIEEKTGKSQYYQYTTDLSNKETIIVEGNKNQNSYQIFPLYISINSSYSPLLEGDIYSTRFTYAKTAPEVNFRILIKDMYLY